MIRSSFLIAVMCLIASCARVPDYVGRWKGRVVNLTAVDVHGNTYNILGLQVASAPPGTLLPLPGETGQEIPLAYYGNALESWKSVVGNVVEVDGVAAVSAMTSQDGTSVIGMARGIARSENGERNLQGYILNLSVKSNEALRKMKRSLP